MYFDVIVVGAGPAGIFTALELKKRAPSLSILMVDEGRHIDSRSCPARASGQCTGCSPCNIMSGWSGAGAFSDGKLSLSEEVGGNLTDYMPVEQVRELIQYTDAIYTQYGAPDTVYGRDSKEAERIAYECRRHNIQLIHCPVRHMGTEYSFETLRNMYNRLAEQPGFTFRELTKADKLMVENGRVTGVELVSRNGDIERAETAAVVAAPGRGGADWLARTAREHGIETRNNAVDIGVRVEVPNAITDHLTAHLYEA
ncbi:MAG: FAD-dependent oxidoreductase, partial [Oscillospiraceae bacterium]|nr:FAD-dependent oxidoreductase [Oscillospiraceae bacterium]